MKNASCKRLHYIETAIINLKDIKNYIIKNDTPILPPQLEYGYKMTIFSLLFDHIEVTGETKENIIDQLRELKEMNNQNQLSCGCVRGGILCQEAVNILEMYSHYYCIKNNKKAKLYREKYEEHLKKK